MTVQPASHQLAQAVLYPGPGVLITLHKCSAQQLQAIHLIGGLTTTVRLDFPSAPLDKCGDAQHTRYSGWLLGARGQTLRRESPYSSQRLLLIAHIRLATLIPPLPPPSIPSTL